MRTARILLSALLVAVGGLALTGPPTAAAASYRYWSYWVQSGSGWTFSQLGPASTVPKDGSTEGWRFAVSTQAASGATAPRISPASAFAQFCSGKKAKRSQKRVAVVIDYGTASHAPAGQSPPAARGACAIVPKAATGAQVLTAAARVRSNQSGLVCALDGYPANECAVVVSGGRPTAKPKPTRTPKPKPTRTARPKPSKTAKPEPTRTSRPKPTRTAEPKPTTPAKPTKPAKPVKPERTAPAEPSRGTSAPASKPAGGSAGKSAKSTNSINTSKPNSPSKQEKSAKPPQSAKPSEPTKSDSESDKSKKPATGEPSNSPGASASATDRPSPSPVESGSVTFAEAGSGSTQPDRPLLPILLAIAAIVGLAGFGIVRKRSRN